MDLRPKPLLYIRAEKPKSTEPLIDDLTKKMAAALRVYNTGINSETFIIGGKWHGYFQCICGAYSTDVDYLLPSGYVTNSLCIHYLAWHRDEIPEYYINAVASLPDEFIDPTPEQLQ